MTIPTNVNRSHIYTHVHSICLVCDSSWSPTCKFLSLCLHGVSPVTMAATRHGVMQQTQSADMCMAWLLVTGCLELPRGLLWNPLCAYCNIYNLLRRVECPSTCRAWWLGCLPVFVANSSKDASAAAEGQPSAYPKRIATMLIHDILMLMRHGTK